MPRAFVAASSEKITLALGGGGSLNGAFTLASIHRKTAADGTSNQWLSIGTNSANTRRLVTSNTDFLQARSGNATSRTTVQKNLQADGWVCMVVTKAAGTATPRFHYYKYSTRAWVHENGNATLTDSTPDTASVIGSDGASAFSTGDLHAEGAWTTAMTDAQVESLPFSFGAWFSYSPNGLWLLDQGATSIKVWDYTGKGANESAIVGTAVSTVAVPVFNRGHVLN